MALSSPRRSAMAWMERLVPDRAVRASGSTAGGILRPRMRLHVLPLLACAAATAVAQAPQFAPPVRLKAGDTFLGENRLYPSPVFHDLDGDGRVDVVVGDLVGALTVAPRANAAAGAPTYGPEAKVLAADGQPLDFDNW